ncbi:MAG: alanine racemase [Gemmatimonadales bacterium]
MERHGPWLEVDLAALQRNARRYAQLVGARILPMVKADAYGLGAVAVARALEPLSPWGFGVAALSEAVALRQAGVTRPIVCVTPFVPGDEPSFLEHRVRPAIASVAGLTTWTGASREPFHLSIETGMMRGGIRWNDDADLEAASRMLEGAPGYEGAFTHFHSADDSSESTELQWTRFQSALAKLGGRPPLVHAANSAAAQWDDRFAGTLARPGIFLYGGKAGALEPEPVARLTARVVAVQQGRPGDTVSYGATYRLQDRRELATLAIGYADGLPRSLGNRGRAWLQGARQPIAGRVTMDLTVLATTPGTATVGDVAELYGPSLSIDAQAEAAGTIAYELLTSVGKRVSRQYRGLR